MADNPFVKLAYVLAAVLFIFGLKMMAHPRTAVRGNLLGALGMLLAVAMALAGDWIELLVHRRRRLVIGFAIGAVLAM